VGGNEIFQGFYPKKTTETDIYWSNYISFHVAGIQNIGVYALEGEMKTKTKTPR
jgi:hypothetical protein